MPVSDHRGPAVAKNIAHGSDHPVTRVSDQYLDTTNNRTLIRGEISHANNQFYYGNEG